MFQKKTGSYIGRGSQNGKKTIWNAFAGSNIELLNSNEDASKRFWTLEERIKKDKKHPGVMIELSRSEMIWDLARLIQLDVITEDDLDGFSEELIEEVRAIIHRG